MASVQIPQIRFDDVRGKHVLVALSGGADSVALLHLLDRNRTAYDLHLTAAHLHHGIRGCDADDDAALCRNLCAGLGIRLIEGRVDVPQLARERGQGLEEAARDARYAFLRQARADCGADVIALAHHLDDQAETVLMHLLRGAGPEGICGMRRMQGELYRPLLEVRKSALMQFLEDAGIPWREDATNAAADNPRNALRLNVLPEIEKSYPSAAEAIARYARIAQAESDYVSRRCDAFFQAHVHRFPCGWRIDAGAAEEVLLRRTIRRICGCGLPARKLDEIMDLCAQPHGRLALGGGILAEQTGGALYLLTRAVPVPEPVPLPLPGEAELRGIGRIRVELGEFPIEPGADVEVLDAQALGGAVLRTRRSGDRIHPLGAPGDRLLSDHLIDRKVDRPLRDVLPLIAIGSRVLWVAGQGIAEDARITQTTRARARIRFFPTTDEQAEVYR
ncbi:MAG: tRNA lysidine(34) synthetase TilS [Aristaeellaceae bacterium]